MAVVLFSLLLSLAQQRGVVATTRSEWAPRQELSLDGEWEFVCSNGTTGRLRVPQFWDAVGWYGCESATYARTVDVPAVMRPHALYLRFASVEQVARVFVDGVLCGSHIGGGLAFSVPISGGRCAARAGASFALRVEVSGGSLPPIVPANRDGKRCAELSQSDCAGPPNDRNNCTWDNGNAGNPWGGGACVGVPQWPVGWYGQCQRWGIGDSVLLRAVGAAVHVEETYAFADAHDQTLHINYTLRNVLSQPLSVQVRSTAVPKPGQQLEPSVSEVCNPTVQSSIVAVPARGIAIVSVALDWSCAEVWFPERPALYELRVSVLDSSNGTVLDNDMTVVGFKRVEVAPGGEHLLLNGLRLNLRGTSIHPSQDFQSTWSSQAAGGLVANWPKTVAKWKALGVTTLRIHQGPAPEKILEGCDEGGLMIIEESAVYARAFMFFSPTQQQYVSNSEIWIEEWVRQRRNHASIVLWSAENENGAAFTETYDGVRYTILSDAQIMQLAATIHKVDPTRPVGCDGDQIGSAHHFPTAPHYIVTNYHYPEGYGNSWGSTEKTIYLLPETAGRPNAVGEFVTDYQSKGNGGDNKLWHGLVVRGLRYTNWVDIRPYTLEWALHQTTEDPELHAADLATAVESLRNGLSAVALFDREYDDLGPVPMLESLPYLGDNRVFVLYNDEFTGSNDITATWTLWRIATDLGPTQQVLGNTQLNATVHVGEHIEIQCEFISCGKAGENPEEIVLVLSTAKGGEAKFTERKSFHLADPQDCAVRCAPMS